MFRKRYTDWIPLGVNTFGDTHHVIMVRRNLKTGMMKFKSKRVQGFHHHKSFLPHNLIDVQKQWDLITT